jgi:hypothetical protein
VAQVVECLPSRDEVLRSNTGTAKKEKEKYKRQIAFHIL